MNIGGKTGQAASSNPRKLLKAAKSYVLPQSQGVFNLCLLVSLSNTTKFFGAQVKSYLM